MFCSIVRNSEATHENADGHRRLFQQNISIVQIWECSKIAGGSQKGARLTRGRALRRAPAIGSQAVSSQFLARFASRDDSGSSQSLLSKGLSAYGNPVVQCNRDGCFVPGAFEPN